MRFVPLLGSILYLINFILYITNHLQPNKFGIASMYLMIALMFFVWFLELR